MKKKIEFKNIFHDHLNIIDFYFLPPIMKANHLIFFFILGVKNIFCASTSHQTESGM